MQQEANEMIQAFKNRSDHFLLQLVCWMTIAAYTAVGQIAQRGNENNGRLLLSQLDFSIGYDATHIIPYLLSFVLVPLFYLFFFNSKHVNLSHKFAGLFTSVLSLAVFYAIFLLFPTSIILIKEVNIPHLSSGILDQLAQITYGFISPWNSFPSIHVGTGWICFRLLQFVQMPKNIRFRVNVIYLIWFVSMYLGSIQLQFHSLVDGLMSIFIIELILRLTVRRRYYLVRRYIRIGMKYRIAALVSINGLVLSFFVYAFCGNS